MNTHPKLVSLEKTAYGKNKFIGESGRLISDIIEITDLYNLEVFL